MLVNDIGLSLLRWFLGLFFGGIAGLFLATIGRFRNFDNRWLGRILDFLRAIPIIGLVPIIQMNLGIHEYGKIGLISWGVMFPVWLTVRFSTSKKLIDSNLMLIGANLSDFQRSRIYLWPRILGGLINGLEIGIGIAWLCVVAAEWVGTYTKGFWSGGLGYRLIFEYQNNNWEMVHLCLVLFGVLGTATALLWKISVKSIIRKLNGFDPVRWMRRG